MPIDEIVNVGIVVNARGSPSPWWSPPSWSAASSAPTAIDYRSEKNVNNKRLEPEPGVDVAEESEVASLFDEVDCRDYLECV